MREIKNRETLLEETSAQIEKPKTIKEFEEVLSKKYKIGDKLTARGYIFPDGKNLELNYYNSHGQVNQWLIQNNYVDEYEGIYDGGCPPLEDLGCIRTNLETEGFIMLSKVEPTAKQYEVLLDFFDKYLDRKHQWRYGSDLMILTPHQKSDFAKISLTNKVSEDIVDIIRNYYRTGRIVESKKIENLTNIEAMYLLEREEEFLKEEKIETDRFDVFVFESPYQVKNKLLSSNESFRIFIDEKTSLYLLGLPYETTHVEMIDVANENGFNTSIDDFNKNKLCAVFVPYGDEEYGDRAEQSLVYDDYDAVYEYDNFKVYSRYQDFSKFKLASILGKYKKRKIKINEVLKEESLNDIDSQGNKLTAEQSEFFKNSKIRNKQGELLVVYHGTSTKFKDEYFKSDINWFTASEEYANQFANFASKDGGHKYKCYLNCEKVFYCGVTDGQIFQSLSPTEPYKFTSIFELIVKKLNIEEKLIRDIIKDVANEFDEKANGYRMKIHVLTRSSKFKDLLVERGYDCIICIENTNVLTIGVFNANQIKSIDNKNPTNSKNINEYLNEDIDDKLQRWQLGGENFEDIFDAEDIKHFDSNIQVTDGHLYRCQKDIQHLKVGDVLDFDRYRSFSKSEQGFYDVMFMADDSSEDFICLKTQGEVSYFDTKNKYTLDIHSDDYEFGSSLDTQEEVFVKGKFKVVKEEEVYDEYIEDYHRLFVIEQVKESIQESKQDQQNFIKKNSTNSISINESNDDETITLYTYQSKETLTILKKGMTYVANANKGMFKGKKDENPYYALTRLLNLTNSPIFCGASITGLDSMIEASGLNVSRKVLLTLNVPKSEINIMEYYDWTDYMYALESSKEFEQESGISISELEKIIKENSKNSYQSFDLPQVVLNRIESTWLVEKYINEVKENKNKSINRMTEKDVLDAVEKLSDRDDISYNDIEAIEFDSPVVILTPGGDILNVNDYDTHTDFLSRVYDIYSEEDSADNSENDEENEDEMYSEGLYDYAIDVLGFITLNTGDGYSDDRCKIVVSKRPTQKQINLLREWLERRIKEDKPIVAFVGGRQKTFYTNEPTYSASEIIKSIQRSFLTGMLEDKKNDKDKLKVYRVGEIKDDMMFFADSLDYYDSSMTGYSKDEAKEYILDISKVKIWYPIKELSLEADTWSTIWGRVEDFDRLDIRWENDGYDDWENGEPEYGYTTTDDLANAGKSLGYDVIVFTDIPGDYGRGSGKTEYAVSNKSIVKLVNENKFLEESANTSWNNIYSLIKKEFGVTNNPPKGPAYILPTGEFLNVEKWWNSYYGEYDEETDDYNYGNEKRDTLYKDISPEEVSSKVRPGSFPMHSLVQYYINKKLGDDSTKIDTNNRLDDDNDVLVQNGCIKVNSGETMFDNFYVNLPNKRPTNQALESLDEYIFNQFYKNDKDILRVYVQDNPWTATKYKRDDYADTKEIIKKITKYYTSGGKLEESISNKEKESIDKLDELFGQEEPYIWSTYILPNGHFLNPENYKADDEWLNNITYEHEDYYIVFNDDNKNYNVLEDYCIKVNVTYPYVAMPNNRPTAEQFSSFKKLLNYKHQFEYSFDEISDRVKNSYDVFEMSEPLMIIVRHDEIAVDLAVTDVSSIVKMISRAYTTGTLLTESTLNEDNLNTDNIFYRFSIKNSSGINVGGLFKAVWQYIFSDENKEEESEDDAEGELENLIDDLMELHETPEEHLGETIKFAFSKKFVDKNIEKFNRIGELLNEGGWSLVKTEINRNDVKVIFEDENQIAFKKTGAKMKESLKSKGNITDKKIIKYVEECIDTLNKLGFKIDDDLELHQGDSLHTFGTFSFPKDDKSSPKLTLNKYMFEEPEESIKNTIYHELCHYLVYKDGVKAGVYFYANLQGKWKYNTTELKKYSANFWKHHGYKWKEYADRVGRAVRHDITRTNSYATHTGVGQQYDKSVKYVVKCNNCNSEIKYTKRTEFVKDPNVIGRSGFYKWSCGKCKAKGQWSVKEVGKDEQ